MTSSALRDALVASLSERSAEFIDSLAELVERRVDVLGQDTEDREWVRASARTNVELLLQVMAYPEELDRVEPPLGGVALVRRIAQRDVPFYELVRGYQLAEWSWVRLCMRQIATLTTDVADILAETEEVSALVHDYIDQVCRALSVEYEQERDRWRQREESARHSLVTRILRGAAVDLVEAEATLGYRLTRNHLAAILWFAGPGQSGDELLRLKRAATDVARGVHGTGRSLIVARDHTTVWLWMPSPDARATPDADSAVAGVVGRLASEHPHIRIALGDAAGGVDGFVTSHRRARVAHEVGSVAGASAGPVFPYRAVSGLAFLCADMARARTWVGEILGRLAADRPREAELRHTLRIYAAEHASATATARRMNCHKNTIQYRIRSAERLLGHAVEAGGPNLQLALLAERWLAEAVTRRPE